MLAYLLYQFLTGYYDTGLPCVVSSSSPQQYSARRQSHEDRLDCIEGCDTSSSPLDLLVDVSNQNWQEDVIVGTPDALSYFDNQQALQLEHVSRGDLDVNVDDLDPSALESSGLYVLDSPEQFGAHLVSPSCPEALSISGETRTEDDLLPKSSSFERIYDDVSVEDIRGEKPMSTQELEGKLGDKFDSRTFPRSSSFEKLYGDPIYPDCRVHSDATCEYRAGEVSMSDDSPSHAVSDAINSPNIVCYPHDVESVSAPVSAPLRKHKLLCCQASEAVEEISAVEDFYPDVGLPSVDPIIHRDSCSPPRRRVTFSHPPCLNMDQEDEIRSSPDHFQTCGVVIDSEYAEPAPGDLIVVQTDASGCWVRFGNNDSSSSLGYSSDGALVLKDNNQLRSVESRSKLLRRQLATRYTCPPENPCIDEGDFWMLGDSISPSSCLFHTSVDNLDENDSVTAESEPVHVHHSEYGSTSGPALSGASLNVDVASSSLNIPVIRRLSVLQHTHGRLSDEQALDFVVDQVGRFSCRIINTPHPIDDVERVHLPSESSCESDALPTSSNWTSVFYSAEDAQESMIEVHSISSLCSSPDQQDSSSSCAHTTTTSASTDLPYSPSNSQATYATGCSLSEAAPTGSCFSSLSSGKMASAEAGDLEVINLPSDALAEASVAHAADSAVDNARSKSSAISLRSLTVPTVRRAFSSSCSSQNSSSSRARVSRNCSAPSTVRQDDGKESDVALSSANRREDGRIRSIVRATGD